MFPSIRAVSNLRMVREEEVKDVWLLRRGKYMGKLGISPFGLGYRLKRAINGILTLIHMCHRCGKPSGKYYYCYKCYLKTRKKE